MVIKLAGIIFTLSLVGLASSNLTLLINNIAHRYHPRTTIKKVICR